MTELRAVERVYKLVPHGLIDPPALASRASMSEQGLDELVASIRAHGVLQPLSVASNGERYEVIAGHRRWMAAGRAGLVTVPCLVYPSVDAALEAVKYAENRHREELNAADEAMWFNELLEQRCGGDVDVLCELLHESRGYVEGRLLLFQGDEKVFHALQAGKIKIGVAHQLNRCTDELQRRSFLHSAIVGGATIAVVSGWIQQWLQEQALIAHPDAAPATTVTPAPVPDVPYFRCYICLKTHNVASMRPINVHGSCVEAILDPLLGREPGGDPQDGTGPDPRRT